MVAAAEALEVHSQASFNQMVVRLGLEDEIPEDTGTSVQKKCAKLARIVVRESQRKVEALEGFTTLGEAVVAEAAASAQEGTSWRPQASFEQALAREGHALQWMEGEGSGRWTSSGASIVPALPPELGRKDGEDEVRALLTGRDFGTSLGHLNQALKAHGRGDWAAANGQIRTFLDSLIEETCAEIGNGDVSKLTLENRLRKLTKLGFLSSERGEWRGDGKGFMNGLTKLLHSQGAHPGLSDPDHCTFRLHLALVTGRHLLRRLKDWQRSN